ncbi:MAG: anti-sigma factor antagonist [Smithella sp.]|mgnify:CR=1 FL=1|nr:anti-sigma factor antagonist [Smithella sp.]MDM7986560.1 STAS/SEC14 domain-containing protein [Smithella sp.]HOU50371.1 STAS/SEC14 domain-containing protein [Smithella sp.]HQH16650.1 STAS/SEC14 domain-containing protein [Smithella sp.]HQI72519.1 STAS/SEC14 domain-containing protein [Smithella sp.]
MGRNAEYEITSSVKDGVFEVTLVGELSESNVEKMQRDFSSIIKANGVQDMLVDIRDLDGRFMVESAYRHIERILTDQPNVNIAIVDFPDNLDFASHFEKSTMQSGQSLKCFTDMDAARAWLKSNKEENEGFNP